LSKLGNWIDATANVLAKYYLKVAPAEAIAAGAGFWPGEKVETVRTCSVGSCHVYLVSSASSSIGFCHEIEYTHALSSLIPSAVPFNLIMT
jgi:hypothetical protein